MTRPDIEGIRERAGADTVWMYDSELNNHLWQRAADCDALLAYVAELERTVSELSGDETKRDDDKETAFEAGFRAKPGELTPRVE